MAAVNCSNANVKRRLTDELELDVSVKWIRYFIQCKFRFRAQLNSNEKQFSYNCIQRVGRNCKSQSSEFVVSFLQLN